MWDAWAKLLDKPLWKLLVDLPPEKIVQIYRLAVSARCIDTRRSRRDSQRTTGTVAKTRGQMLRQQGPKAYSTAGWLGLTDAQIVETVNQVKADGLDCFKMKVGQDMEFDKKRLAFIRETIGSEARLMLDANQIWGVDEAIAYMEELGSVQADVD